MVQHKDGCKHNSFVYKVDTDPDYNAPECKEKLKVDCSGAVYEYGIYDDSDDSDEYDEDDPNRGPYGTHIDRIEFSFCPFCGVPLK